MSRVQLAINVTDIDEAVDFYSKLFRTGPAKRKPGYANFAIVEPALKLVLIENPDSAGSLNHLGVEVFSTAEVTAAERRLEGDGLATAEESGVCCYADQEKVWVNDPDGTPWEIYTVVAHSETSGSAGGGSGYHGSTCGVGACVATEGTDVATCDRTRRAPRRRAD